MLNHGDHRLGSLLLDAKMDKGFPRVARVGASRRFYCHLRPQECRNGCANVSIC
jgi:hypothetical protein